MPSEHTHINPETPLHFCISHVVTAAMIKFLVNSTCTHGACWLNVLFKSFDSVSILRIEQNRKCGSNGANSIILLCEVVMHHSKTGRLCFNTELWSRSNHAVWCPQERKDLLWHSVGHVGGHSLWLKVLQWESGVMCSRCHFFILSSDTSFGACSLTPRVEFL